MSHTTSRVHRKAGVLKDSGIFACSNIDKETASQDQERLAELILKAASLWQSSRPTKTLRYTNKDAPESMESSDELDAVSEKILKALHSRSHARPSDLARLCRVSQPTVQRRLKDLLLVELIAKHGNTKGVSYALPEKEK